MLHFLLALLISAGLPAMLAVLTCDNGPLLMELQGRAGEVAVYTNKGKFKLIFNFTLKKCLGLSSLQITFKM